MGISAPLVINEEGSCLSSSGNSQNDYTWFGNLLQAQNALGIGAGAYYWLSSSGLGGTYDGEYLLSSGYAAANMGQDYINAYTGTTTTPSPPPTSTPTPTPTPTSTPTPTPTPTPPPTQTLPFTDNFANLNAWTIVDGTWTLMSGGVQGSGSSEALMYAGSTSWTNYQVTAPITISAGGEASIVFRYSSSSSFYWAGLGCWGTQYSISKMVGRNLYRTGKFRNRFNQRSGNLQS